MTDGLWTHSRRYLTGSFAPPPIIPSFMVVQPLSMRNGSLLASVSKGRSVQSGPASEGFGRLIPAHHSPLKFRLSTRGQLKSVIEITWARSRLLRYPWFRLVLAIPAVERNEPLVAISRIRANRHVWSAAWSQAENESDRMVCANVFGLRWTTQSPETQC